MPFLLIPAAAPAHPVPTGTPVGASQPTPFHCRAADGLLHAHLDASATAPNQNPVLIQELGLRGRVYGDIIITGPDLTDVPETVLALGQRLTASAYAISPRPTTSSGVVRQDFEVFLPTTVTTTPHPGRTTP